MTSTTKTKTGIQIGAVYLVIMVIVIAAPYFRSLADTFLAGMFIKFTLYLAMVGVVVIVCRIFSNPILPTLGFSNERPGRQILLAIPVWFFLAVIIVGLSMLLGMDPKYLLPPKITGPLVLGLTILHQVVFVGMVEELIFRGYFFERLRNAGFSGFWTVFISAFLFGFMHFPVNQDFLQLFLTFLIGCIFGFVRLQLKNCTTLTVGLAHGLHNTVLVLLSRFLL